MAFPRKDGYNFLDTGLQEIVCFLENCHNDFIGAKTRPCRETPVLTNCVCRPQAGAAKLSAHNSPTGRRRQERNREETRGEEKREMQDDEKDI